MNGTQIASVIAAAVAVFWIIGAYNRLVSLRMAIGTAWAQVEEALQRRNQLLPALLTQWRAPLAAEHQALDAVVVALAQVRSAADAVRLRPVRVAPLRAFAVQEAQLRSALARVMALVEALPAPHDGALDEALDQLRALAPRMALARLAFNDAATAYDAAIAQWPTRLLVPWFGFRRAGRL
jgi:LemA protein